MPIATSNINALGTLRLLEAIRILDGKKNIRLYQASSSEMFGSSPAPQNEQTPMHPCSPYGVAKLYAYWMVKTYRDSYGLYAANGILFNHESPLRGEEFVTRKITRAVCEMEQGIRNMLILGNLDARRDWGHARDYMRGAWQILQQDVPDDYVLATGKAYSVREFVEASFRFINVDIVWQGREKEEVGIDKKTGNVLVKINADLFRPKEVNELLGDAGKAKKILKWDPEFSFDELVEDMMIADRKRVQGQI